jgi:hypothetical protein
MGLLELKKPCSKCGVEKPYDAIHFRKNKNKTSGLDSWCRDCANSYRKNKRMTVPPKEWGVPEDQVEKFALAKLVNECVICGLKAEVVDHDHNSGRIRGALCQRCNMGLGHFRDNPELLRLAALYLEGQCGCGECEVYWGGMPGPMEKNGKPTRKALSLRKWDC